MRVARLPARMPNGAMPRPRTFDEGTALDAAMRAFWEHGYQGTTLADLLDRMGMGKASLYAVFGDKEALFLAAISRYREAFTAPSVALLDGAPAMNAVRAYLRDLERRYTDPATPRGCLVTNTVLECPAPSAAVCGAATASIGAGEAAILRTLERARREGGLPDDTDLPALGRLLLGVGQSMALMSKLHATPAIVHDIAQAALDLLDRAFGPARCGTCLDGHGGDSR